MPVQPHEFFILAEITEESDEIFLRNAMSRAYYAVYHECLALSDANDINLDQNSDGGEHQKLCHALQRDGKFAAIGDSLSKLRLKRVRADYHIGATIGLREARKVVCTSKNLFEQTKIAGRNV
ncbi:hypothetical protein A6M27_01215 [Acidithiobacillus thiooxidans]|uniref:HEPN domain-containing protein n=1 Tax=Acidithiobacillus thiooxidans TaxID=930 RepID=A0A1C2IAT0_ACITH|nr:hypothetical protein [Acidithiobacillus thiooxidans]OCX72480.1 hypothetical protein A6P07_09785 [Acidithiobacillus thiooxidans]OCX73092.1 hypothetical protein A6O24_12575 [Acidithiobacillus thiooxidans]OCX74743.1 hypothetical protein A6M23_05080 [Acidithiobacillus thiooxidans]OCX83586.1 hypothetical protein A6O26_06755 [Acidithiobacillus thiooxidans]OCX86950.1 hypothetical protein A6P08_04570 [Acidithiobacillus thiooxidans]